MDTGIGNSLALGPVRAAPTAVAVAPFAAAVKQADNVPDVPPASAVDDQSKKAPVEEAVASIQNFVQSIRRDLNFSLDDSSGRVVIKVTDSVSGEVIRQLPSEEALRLAESLEEVRSLLFKAEA